MTDPDDWEADALCAVEPVGASTRERYDLFFPREGVSDAITTPLALSICWRCPVRVECLSDALSWPASMDRGTRGGFTEEQRLEMHRSTDRDRGAGHPGHGKVEGYMWERRHLGGVTCVACREAEARYRKVLRAEQRRQA